jgi:peptide/nickel transport system permease protein
VVFAPMRKGIHAIWRNRTAVVGSAILVSMIASAVFAPWIAPEDPAAIELPNRLRPPAWSPGGTTDHLFGTDHLGRDVLSRTLFGARVSLLVGLATTMLAASLGTFLGMVSGYFGGRVGLIMRLADVQQAYPFIALAIVLVAVVGPGLKTVILVLGIGGWVLFARVVQSQVLSLRERDYVEAARVVGANDLRIMFRHILPNIASPLIVLASFAFSAMIVTEASLSFLGFGVQPPQSTWGLMLSQSRDYMQVAWWLPTFPGLAIVITVLGANLLGDWVRDVLDPRLRRV